MKTTTPNHQYNDQYQGLSNADVIKSREIYGANELEQKRQLNIFQKVLHVFAEPMFIFLLVAASIYFLVGEFTDGIIMIMCVLFVSGIEFFQEQRTDKALEALNTLSDINIQVIRGGKETTVSSKEIVVGDIVLLAEGDRVPADGHILELQGLGLDESALTGESAIVYKKLQDHSKDRFKLNMCYAGTNVINGSAVIKVSAVGTSTEYGKIGNTLNSIKKVKTPLEKQIKRLITICTIVSLTFCVIVTVVNFFYNSHLVIGDRIVQSILSGITMAMATIPEEIPVVLTVFLAMGAWKLAQQKALARNTKAVETLGAITVLCTDKTGTLTQNKMTVQDISSKSEDFLQVAALACPKTPYDPMEVAIQEYAFSQDVQPTIYQHRLLHEYAFNNEDKMMGQVWQLDDDQVLCVKGAYESILPLCGLSQTAKQEIITEAHNFSALGYRVLAIAKRDHLTKIPQNLNDNRLTFCGLIALIDPPRVGVKKSIEACHDAGIRIIMITGDNGETAQGIAKQIGLNHAENVITGAELEAMDDQELVQRVRDTNIFARVYPDHKMRIVNALQGNHEVVAMTGDGINDAPALKQAEIGIAMGQRGTNVAKEAADLILMDDNFNTIVDAIANGRVIYSNIKKAISYLFVIHIPIILISLFVPLFGLPLLLLPVHIVLLELIIDPTSSIIFQRIKADSNVMHTRPRPLNESLISLAAFSKCLLQGTAIFLVTFLSYVYLIKTGASQALASTFAFTTLVFANILVVYVLQSSRLALYNFITSLKDKVTVIINLVIVIIFLALIYVPIFNRFIGATPLNLPQLLFAIGLAALATFIFDLNKLIRPRKDK